MSLKKILSIGGALSITGLLVFNACGHRPRYCYDDFTERILKRVDKKVAKLELTTDQQNVYNDIRVDIGIDLENFRDSRLKAHTSITEELSAEDPDMGKIAGIMKKVHKEHPVKFDAYLDRSVEFYNILDETQKKMVLERLRDFADHFTCD